MKYTGTVLSGLGTSNSRICKSLHITLGEIGFEQATLRWELLGIVGGAAGTMRGIFAVVAIKTFSE